MRRFLTQLTTAAVCFLCCAAQAASPKPVASIPAVLSIKFNAQQLELSLNISDFIPIVAYKQGNDLLLILPSSTNITMPSKLPEGLTLQQSVNSQYALLRVTMADGRFGCLASVDGVWCLQWSSQLQSAQPIELSHEVGLDECLSLTIPKSVAYSLLRAPVPGLISAGFFIPFSFTNPAYTFAKQFSNFKIIECLNGMLILPNDENVRVEKTTTGLKIFRVQSVAEVANNVASVSESAIDSDFKAFELPIEQYFSHEQKLIQQITACPAKERDVYRLNLAKFYFANKRYNEAIAICKLLPSSTARFLQGMGYCLLGQYEDAVASLTDYNFIEKNQEVIFWQQLSQILLHKESGSVQFVNDAKALLATYPACIRNDLIFILGRFLTGLKAADIDLLQQVDATILTLTQSHALEFLQAQFSLLAENAMIGKKLLATLATKPVTEYSVQARLLIYEMQFLKREITIDQYIQMLENLRFQWKRDALEFDTLNMLGDLYHEKGKFIQGFMVLDQAIKKFPAVPQSRDVAEKLQKRLQELLLKNGQELFLTHVVIYKQFKRHITDNAVKRLILEEQVKNLSSAGIINLAADCMGELLSVCDDLALSYVLEHKLANMYLRMHNPRMALKIVSADLLDPTMQKDRLRIKAKALLLLKDEKALEPILATFSQVEAAKYLRDLSLEENDWSGIVEAYRADGSIFTSPQDMIGLVAAIYLQNDSELLHEVSQKYEGKFLNTEYQGIFELLTKPYESKENGYAYVNSLVKKAEKLTQVVAQKIAR